MNLIEETFPVSFPIQTLGVLVVGKLLSSRRALSWFLISATLILILACSSDDEASNVTSSGEAATAVPAKDPVTVTDALGQAINFEEPPKKIVTLSPTATEILYAAGGAAILRDRASNFPVEAQSLPDAGSAYNPSIEAVVEVQPDLVIIEALTQARFVSILKQSGLKVMAVKAETVDDITNQIINVGKVIGEEAVANERVAEITRRLEQVGSSDSRTFLILISDQDRNLYAARSESYTGLVATTLGLKNKAEGLPDSGPYPGFSMMSTEAILMANPDIIVTITPAPEPAPRLSDTITRIPPFAGLTAVRTRSIFEGDVTLLLQAPGPRIVEAVESLSEGLKFEDR
ncbi:MAG: ABC transporter substrate-binding protein [SAR202 cluster bacterium]|nr:ABC transporter substrate-binding protein [SAR202 cluster bacterium]